MKKLLVMGILVLSSMYNEKIEVPKNIEKNKTSEPQRLDGFERRL